MLSRPIFRVMVVLLLAIGGILCALSLIGRKKELSRICLPIVISPNGEELAFTVARRRGERQSYLLKLGGNGASRVIPIPGAKASTTGMAWRAGASPPELFVVTFSSKPVSSRILGVTVSGGVSTTFSQDVPKDLLRVLAYLSWNPSGQILAFQVMQFGEEINALLGIFYNSSKGIAITDIAMGGGCPVWTNDRTLYIRNKNGDILELNIVDKKVQVKQTFVFAKDGETRLSGSLDGKLVYRLDNDIYCGNQLLYHSDQKVKQLMSSGSYLAFKAGNCIWVLDREGNVVNKRNVGEDEYTTLIALSSAHRFVYLMTNNLQSIQRYSFVKADRISTVYDVTH